MTTTEQPTAQDLRWAFSGGTLHLRIPPDGPVQLVSLGPDGPASGHSTPLVELSAGPGSREASGHAAHVAHAEGARLRHAGTEERAGESGAELRVAQADDTTGLRVVSVLQDVVGTGALRAWTEVTAGGEAPVRLRYVSSLPLTGVAADAAAWPDLHLHVVHNGWSSEFRWQRLTLEQAGLVAIGYPGSATSRSRFAVTGHGSFSSGDHLPMGALTDAATGRAWVWQVEHNGAWHWEATDLEPDLVVRLSGPTEAEHQWTTLLAPGEAFTTVPVSVATAVGGPDDGLQAALAALTRYRRATRRPNEDDESLPVVFNDYMNALMGDPTTAKLLPLVDAAAAAGAEHFVIDAGWYTDEQDWWDLVGEWRESPRRFPGGLREVTDRIRARGMVPGLWLEPEVVGVRSPVAEALPEEAFFQRDGERVVVNRRYQLDYRHPAVTAAMDAVVDRLVAEHGVGYLKFDHNINAGAGTDVAADSPGDGLLGHNRAVSAWLDGIFARHPQLVVENCSSGGMRVDHAQLSRLSIQSTSDQQDPVLTSMIACAAPSAVTPEQAAVWAYPQPEMSGELLDLTMVNALLGRIHLSGRLDRVSPEQMAAVTAAVEAYKGVRSVIPRAVPAWPLGLPGWYDPWLATALSTEEETLLQVWRRRGAEAVDLPLPHLAGVAVAVEVLHPAGAPVETHWDPGGGRLHVRLPAAPSARLLRLRRA